ncbi:MAG: hypothetical protein ACTJLL_03200 [Anaplasma sp.]
MFLSRATARVAVEPPARDGAFHFTLRCRSNNKLCAIRSILPGKVNALADGECNVRIKRSDVIRLREMLRNPVRAAAFGEEYDVRLVTYLLFEATGLFREYGEDLYSHIHDQYIHDMRAGAGKFQQIINYIRGAYPGRLPVAAMGQAMPLCFPNPALLDGYFEFCEQNWCYVLKLGNARGARSLLLETAAMKLEQLNAVESLSDAQSVAAECLSRLVESASEEKIEIPCEDFFVIIREIIGDVRLKSHVEQQLFSRQEQGIIDGLTTRFRTACGACGVGVGSATGVSRAISSLKKVRALVRNSGFFQKLNSSGILQAQQYFGGMNAIIAAMISFLQSHQELTEPELQFFLQDTCGDIINDIGHLLAIHDFLSIGGTIDRDAIVKFTRREISEISAHINRYISQCSEIFSRLENEDESSLECVIAALRLERVADDESVDCRLSSLLDAEIFVRNGDTWAVNNRARNERLFRHLKSHALCDFLCDFEYEGGAECDKFLDRLFASGCTSDDALLLLKHIVKSREREWVKDVACSAGLRVAQSVYNTSRFLPFHSLWAAFVNPARYRTSSGYKGSGIAGRLYARNKEIPFTEFSREISEGLYLTDHDYRFVSGNYEAEMLCRSFRVRHNIPGFFERAVFPVRRYKLVWYIVLGLLFVLCSVIAVIGRLMDHFGIIPGVLVKGVLDVFRAIFETTVVIVGLDTMVGKGLSVIINTAGFFIRILDFILLGGLISRVTRFIFVRFYSGCDYLFNAIMTACENVRRHGIGDACYLLMEKVFCRGTARGSPVPTMSSPACEEARNIGNSPAVAPHMLVEQVYGECQSVSDTLRSFSHTIACELYGQKPEVGKLLREFRRTLTLPQTSTFEGNYLRIRREFFFLLNNYQEEFSASRTQPSRATIFNSYDARRAVYDKITAVNVQTLQMMRQGDVATLRSIENHMDSRAVLNAACEYGESITLRELNEKIAALCWALSVIDAHDITGVVARHETLILDTKVEKSCIIALMDCVLTLQNFRRSLLTGRNVSRDLVLNDFRVNFSSYIRDVCCIVGAVDRSITLRHHTASYRKFCNIMCTDFLLLETPSFMAERVSSFVNLSLGVKSYFSVLKDELVDFEGDLRECKYLLASFLMCHVMESSSINGLASFCSQGTRLTSHALDAVGLGVVYDFFMTTQYGERFLAILWCSLYPRDLVAYLKKCALAISLLNAEELSAISGTIDHCIYQDSFLRQGHALGEVKSVLNSLGDLFCTIFQVHAIRASFESTKTLHCGSMEYFMQRKEITTCSDARSLDVVDAAACSANILQQAEVDVGIQCRTSRRQ